MKTAEKILRRIESALLPDPYESDGDISLTWFRGIFRSEAANLRKELQALEEDAARWRALINCTRIRGLGNAGLGKPGEYNEPDQYGYAHVGLELWTHYIYPEGYTQEQCDESNVLGRKWLLEYADRCVEVAEGKYKELEGNGKPRERDND